jgi:hypothetical protein
MAFNFGNQGVESAIARQRRVMKENAEAKKAAKKAAAQAVVDAKVAVVSASRNQETLLGRKRKKRDSTLLVSGVKDSNTAPSAYGGGKTLLGE